MSPYLLLFSPREEETERRAAIRLFTFFLFSNHRRPDDQSVRIPSHKKNFFNKTFTIDNQIKPVFPEPDPVFNVKNDTVKNKVHIAVMISLFHLFFYFISSKNLSLQSYGMSLSYCPKSFILAQNIVRRKNYFTEQSDRSGSFWIWGIWIIMLCGSATRLQTYLTVHDKILLVDLGILPVANMEAIPAPMRTEPACSQRTVVSPKKDRTEAPAETKKRVPIKKLDLLTQIYLHYKNVQ